MYFLMTTQYNHGAQSNMPKHVVYGDDVSTWAETNNGKKNAEASLAAIQLAGLAQKSKRTPRLCLCVIRRNGKIVKITLLNPFKVRQFSNILKRH
jgi:hypothetical protein